jgi:hypothetical protein
MKVLKRSVLFAAVLLVVVTMSTGTALAKTVKLSSSERTRLTTFLNAFCWTKVPDFSTARGISDAALIEFSTRKLYLSGQYTATPDGKFAINAGAADNEALVYFGRKPANRNADSGVAYSAGAYVRSAYDTTPPSAKALKVTSTHKGRWTVTFNKFGWDGQSPTDLTLAQCVATLKVSAGAKPKYTLRGLATTRVRVPKVRGSFFTDAQTALKFYGFRYRSIAVYAGNGAPTTDGTVYKQSVRPGTLAPRGSRVTIWWGYEHS